MPKFEKLTHRKKPLTEKSFESASENNEKQQKDLNEIHKIFTYWELLKPEEERFQESLNLLVNKMKEYIQKYNIHY